jgi:hypothetical protein
VEFMNTDLYKLFRVFLLDWLSLLRSVGALLIHATLMDEADIFLLRCPLCLELTYLVLVLAPCLPPMIVLPLTRNTAVVVVFNGTDMNLCAGFISASIVTQVPLHSVVV